MTLSAFDLQEATLVVLSAGNVLLDKWNNAKIADVGLAKRLVNYYGGTQLSTFCRTEEFGTYAWAAPEVI